MLAAILPSLVSAEQLRSDQVYAQSIGAVCTILGTMHGKPISLGSGFIVTADGLVATNWHVVSGAADILVKCGDEQPRRGRVGPSYAPGLDLAVIATGIRSIKPLAISLENPSRLVGQAVYAIGNPEGLEGTISSGLISGIRDVDGTRLIQISAPISRGSSGGPVLLANGQVIGIATSALEDGQNLNFALPAVRLRDVPEVASKLLLREATAGPIEVMQPPRSKRPLELVELTKDLMLRPGNEESARWDVGLDAPIEWLSDGLEEQARGTVRRGRARVVVAGKTMWTPRRQREEVFWDVTLIGWSKGVLYVIITPQSGCFGAENSGCEYDFEQAMVRGGVRTTELCAFHWASEEYVVYRLSAPARQDATAIIMGSCGSGGCMMSLYLHYKRASVEHCQMFLESNGADLHEFRPGRLPLSPVLPK